MGRTREGIIKEMPRYERFKESGVKRPNAAKQLSVAYPLNTKSVSLSVGDRGENRWNKVLAFI